MKVAKFVLLFIQQLQQTKNVDQNGKNKKTCKNRLGSSKHDFRSSLVFLSDSSLQKTFSLPFYSVARMVVPLRDPKTKTKRDESCCLFFICCWADHTEMI